MNGKSAIFAVVSIMVLALSVSTPLISTSNETDDVIADRLAEAINLYSELDFDKGLAITDELFARENLSATDSIAIYEVKSIITYAMGIKFKRKAFAYLSDISDIGPCLIRLPREVWPSELRDKWYHLCKKNDNLSCPMESESGIKTIAIMEFDNYSVGKYQNELGALSKGLADFFEYDFSRFSDLKVVERDKLDFILRELKLVEEGKIDKSTAVKVGKILGAQTMVFGSITQINKNDAVMMARAVNVETSEIIAIAEKRGKPNFLKMEKELVKDMAKQLDILVTDKTTELIDESGTKDMDAAKLYSIGLKYLDKYEYEKAYNHFKKAYDKDNSFMEAKKKMAVYKPLVANSPEETGRK
jgi:TolB-like protein